ncbi:MAG: hypothetical protein M3Y87_07560 [Myxococcota bacterium]|nr:hypothetical protein [Myxococcota bacterium]
MSTEQHTRNRGSLFENADKRKPSQPDLRGDGTIDGVAYDMQAWRRDEQLTLTLAPARGTQNTYHPDAFRGALDAGPKPRGAAKQDPAATPAWVGTIAGDERSYTVKAFQKQGKSGPYLNLFFELAAVVEKKVEWADAEEESGAD